MRRSAGPGDDDFKARISRPLGEVVQPIGRSVGRNDPADIGDAEIVEAFGGAYAWSASRTGCP
jgi:hypothetical protein